MCDFIYQRGYIPKSGNVTVEFPQIPVGCIISHGSWTNQSFDFVAFDYSGSIVITTLAKFGEPLVSISRNGDNLILTNANSDYDMPYGVYLFANFGRRDS